MTAETLLHFTETLRYFTLGWPLDSGLWVRTVCTVGIGSGSGSLEWLAVETADRHQSP